MDQVADFRSRNAEPSLVCIVYQLSDYPVRKRELFSLG